MVDPDAPTPESIESTVWYLFANQHFIREREYPKSEYAVRCGTPSPVRGAPARAL